MYNLIIADDDVIIRRGLSKNIDWEGSGFRLTGAAGSGKEALQFAEELRPDIVVTDIRMPHMDGLELTERLMAKYSDVKVILMTSYEEFEFAQKALKLKAFDYILKPFENEALLEAARRAAAELQREHAVRKQVMDSMPILRQQFWEHLLAGRLADKELEAEAQFLGIDLGAAHYAAVVVKPDEFYSPRNRNRFGQQMLKFCVGNIMEEMTAGIARCYVVHYDAEELVLVVGADDEPIEAVARLQTLLEQLRHNVETYLKTTITAGIGPVYERPHSLHRSYTEARSILEYRHMTGTNQVLVAADADLPDRQPAVETLGLPGWEQELLVKVKLGIREQALAILSRLEQDVLDRKYVPLQHVHILGTEVALLLYREFWEWIHTPQMEQRFGGFTHYCANLQTMTTCRQIFTTLQDFTDALIAEICTRRDSHQKQLLGKACRYIGDHFGREELSLQDVASHVNVSAGYLSAIFKKAGKTTFSEYLLETRMKFALNLMSREDYKAYEIAEKAGFSNPQYFSVCFKKYTGVSPSDYRSGRR